MMPIHKFIRRHERSKPVRTQPDSIYWILKKDAVGVHKPIRQNGGLRWEIFMQEIVTIQPKESKIIRLGFGFQITRGTCIVSLRQVLKRKGLSILEEEEYISENVDDITITIQNTSQMAATISDGESLCYIIYDIQAL